MPILKGIKIGIEVKGRKLAEYGDDHDQNDTPESVTKYVQATSGAAFKVTAVVPKTFIFQVNALPLQLAVDGVDMNSVLCRKRSSKLLQGKDWTFAFDGSPVKIRNRWHKRAFVFNEIKQGKYTLGIIVIIHIKSIVKSIVCPYNPPTDRAAAVSLTLVKSSSKSLIPKPKATHVPVGENTVTWGT